MAEIRRVSNGFQAEMRDALQEPVKLDPVEPEATPPARRPRTRQLRAAGPDGR
jgi:hypothetical protein